MARCTDCPVPVEAGPCRGASIPHKCPDPRYRAYFARLAAAGHPEHAHQPGLPSLATQAANLTAAVAGHVADGLRHADEATVASRLAICEGCPHWRPSDARCSPCGCHTRAKASWRSSSCPIGKWVPA